MEIAILPFLIIIVIWFIPFLMIATSQKTVGGEKVAWLLAMVFISWFAWIFYMLLAPLKPNDHSGY